MERQFSPGKYYLWLSLPAGAVLVVLVRANERQNYVVAQAGVPIILILLALMVWGWWNTNRKAPYFSAKATAYQLAIQKLLLCVAIGFAAVVLNANRWDHWQFGTVARSIGYGVLGAGAFFIGGVLLGYLFGLRPRDDSKSDQSGTRNRPRTNLEEVADWLTKLIIGAGLVSLSNLPNPIGRFVTFMARGIDPPDLPSLVAAQYGREGYSDPGSPAIALAMMGFFSASGLLYGYLWTRYEHAIEEATGTSGADPSAPALVGGPSNPVRSTEGAVSGDP
jgi:hypothetical protein